MKKRLLTLMLPGALLCAGCSGSDNEPFAYEAKGQTKATNLPEIRMDAPVVNSASSVTLTGYLDSEGDGVYRYGFLYSRNNEVPELTQSGNSRKQFSAVALGEFTAEVTIVAETPYYVRAYAISASKADTVYTDVYRFETTVQAPVVETLPVYTRVKRAAIVAGKFLNAGDGLKSYGACISRKPNPDLLTATFVEAQDTAKDEMMRGEFGVFFDDLEPNTLYHVRAYAVNSKDTVYGSDRIFKTSKGGSLTWGWVNEQEALDAGARDRIKVAMDSAKYYYENYSNLAKYIYVQYNTGVQTADCNIEGWMRYGPVERYQWVGTAQHEISHAMGVGTASNWDAMFTNWIWNGYRAQQALRVMMKDMTQNLRVSGVHFYNGGINQKEEVTNGTANSYGEVIKNERMLKLNAIVMSAMREDGLTSW